MSTTVIQNTESIIRKIVRETNDAFPYFLPTDTNFPLFRDPDFGIFQRQAKNISSTPKLNHRPVELLMEEASTLAERCINLREAKLNLEVQAVDFWWEQNLFEKTTKIRLEQIENGELELPSEQTKIRLRSIDQSLNEISELIQKHNTAIERRTEGNDTFENRIEQYSEVARLTGNRSQTLKTAAQRLARLVFIYDKGSSEIGQSSSTLSSINLQMQKRLSENRLTFEEPNKELRRELFDVEVAARRERARIATQTGVGLNFKERLIDVQEMFDREFVSLYARLKAIRDGLKEVYGIGVVNLPEPDDERYTVKYIIWLRNRIEELFFISQNQQFISYSLGIRKMLGETNWRNFLEVGKTTVNFDLASIFDVTPRLVRLRSVDVHIYSENATQTGAWDAWLKCSENNIEKVLFGNVIAREARASEARRVSRALYNAMPIGDWDVWLSSRSSTGQTRQTLTGFDVEFQVVALLS